MHPWRTPREPHPSQRRPWCRVCSISQVCPDRGCRPSPSDLGPSQGFISKTTRGESGFHSSLVRGGTQGFRVAGEVGRYDPLATPVRSRDGTIVDGRHTPWAVRLTSNNKQVTSNQSPRHFGASLKGSRVFEYSVSRDRRQVTSHLLAR